MPSDHFCTQLNQLGSGLERCGAACLASVLLDLGWQSDPWGLTVELADGYGITGHGADSALLGRIAEEKGLAWGPWVSQADAGAHLADGHHVLCLNDNSYLYPRAYPRLLGWNALHWLVLKTLVDDTTMAYVYDPLCYQAEAGAPTWQGPHVYTAESLWEACRQSPTPESGIAVWRP